MATQQDIPFCNGKTLVKLTFHTIGINCIKVSTILPESTGQQRLMTVRRLAKSGGVLGFAHL